MKTKEEFIAERKETMDFMISMYCRKKHSQDLCEDCMELRDYAFERIDSCMNNDSQVRCAGCPARCYNSEMRDRIQDMIGFSRPRMILHPTMLFKKY